MDISTLQSGDIVELLVDANAIPAGRYRFLETDGEMMILSVGNRAILGLAAGFWKSFVRPVKGDNERVTSAGEFAKRYVDLYWEQQASFNSTDPQKFTFCMIDPALMRRASMRHYVRENVMQFAEMFN